MEGRFKLTPDYADIVKVTIALGKVFMSTGNGDIYYRNVEHGENAEDIQQHYWSRGEIDDDCKLMCTRNQRAEAGLPY